VNNSFYFKKVHTLFQSGTNIPLIMPAKASQ